MKITNETTAAEAIRQYYMRDHNVMPDECVGMTTAEAVQELGGAAKLYKCLNGYDDKAATNAAIIAGEPQTLGGVHHLNTVLFALLNEAERAADLAELKQ